MDRLFGLVANHDPAGCEVSIHVDVPHLKLQLVDEIVSTMSSAKAEGVGEPGLRGVAPTIVNAVYNATGVRLREYPITLDGHLTGLPAVA